MTIEHAHLSPPLTNASPSDGLLLGASLIGAPTGESISRRAVGSQNGLTEDPSSVSLVREMAGLTPCALLERAGIKPNRQWRLGMKVGFALMGLAGLLKWLAP